MILELLLSITALAVIFGIGFIVGATFYGIGYKDGESAGKADGYKAGYDAAKASYSPPF